MNHFEDLKLSESKRPILLEDEIECLIVPKISVLDQDTATNFVDGTMTITTHRLFFVDSKKSKSFHLSFIKDIEKKNSFFGSAKISINTLSKKNIKLSFQDKRDQFYDTLEAQLKKKNWLNQKKTETVVGFSTKTAGISGLVKTIKTDEEKQQQNLKTAFQDIDSLMENAREMVKFAEKFSEKMKSQSSSTNEDENVKDWLITMGITSPITKQSTGTLYHQELAKQLCDFLPKYLDQTGMITLTDAYCIYNRARGTDLISPEDMYRACSLMDKMKLNLILKEFESGVLALQTKVEKISEKQILDLIEKNKCLNPVDLSHILEISVLLAKEQLTSAENRGILCRDETPEGIYFYKNIFV